MMTTKQEKVIWSVFAVFLIFLFLLSSTDLIIKDQKREVYPIAVIVEDARDDYYVNFKKGMDQAALEYHADVRFLTLYDRNRTDQQLERLFRETADGARAVIISPSLETEVVKALDDSRMEVPVVMINSPLSHNKISGNVTIDFYKAGRMLGEQVVKEQPPDLPVYVFTEGVEYSSNARFYDGIMAALGQAGRSTKLIQRTGDDTCRRMLEGLMSPGGQRVVLIALDRESLLESAKLLDGGNYQPHITGLYGLGSTLQILNYLDREVIRGVIAYNEFNQGYLSIEMAVAGIGNNGRSGLRELDSCYIKKESLKDKEYEKMLYPMD